MSRLGYKAKIKEISERSLRCESMLQVNENKFRVISTHSPLCALKFCEVQLKIQGVKPQFQEGNTTVTGFRFSATLFCQKENIFKL